VKRVVDWICGGSVEEVLVGMVDARMVDRATVEKLSKRIEQAGAERPLRRARKPVKR
jgi:predicted transcriptional regulator